MSAVTVLGVLVGVLLLPLAVAAVRQRTLVAMAVRNIRRRRGEAVLVIGGALLGTAIITSSFVVGDIVEGSFADVARTRYGPIDLTVTAAEGMDIDAVNAAVTAGAIEGIDGTLVVTAATATLEVVDQDRTVPQIDITELDLAAARRFGGDPLITGLDEAGDVGVTQIVVNARTAADLGVTEGSVLRLHAYGSFVELTVAAVVPEIGLAGYGGAIVAPGTIAGLAGAASSFAAPPQDRLLVSLDGGVFDTRARSEAAEAGLRAAVAGLPGVDVDATKAAVLDDARRDAAGLTQMFSMIGSFSVLAGILLLVNLFVMLAEERKTELGMLRAVGFTRRRLTRSFAVEGAIYSIVAAAFGALSGIGIGWVIALVAGPIFGAAEGSSYPLVIEPASIAIGAGTGLVISLLTVWATSLRIARLNIIRAIRDLPEPKVLRARTRTLVLGAAGVLAGAAVSLMGLTQETAVPLLLGVPVMAFSAAPLLRRLLAERTARILVAGTVLAWGLAVYPMFPAIMGAADMLVFVVQGVVLTTGAVAFAASLDRVWTIAIELLGRGGRGLAPRLGIAYPLARRFRTSMLLGMFSLVIFTVTIMASFTASVESNTDATVAQLAGGFDLLLDANPASPITAASLTDRQDVAGVAGLTRGVATFSAAHLDAPRDWPISGFDEGLLGAGPPGLFSRDARYGSDVDAYRAVLDDPALAIVPEDFLIAGIDTGAVLVGDTFDVIAPDGTARTLTVAGRTPADQVGNGALVSREVSASLLGAGDVVSRTYVELAPGVDPQQAVGALNTAFLVQGADAQAFDAIGAQAVRTLTGFMALMQGFLGLGLLVGIAGLGVVMVRAVRERRREIGMLRAMGFKAGLVRAAMLSEAGLIAVQGTLIGALLGLVTTRQILTGSESFGDVSMPFVVPWVGLLLIVALPLAASMAATSWPAARAARIAPAVALRTAD
jgi:putative ABC transport system permease protein